MRIHTKSTALLLCCMLFLLIPFAVAHGGSRPIDMAMAEVSHNSPDLNTPLQQAYLRPTDPPLIGQYFGWSVDIDGDTAIVGAPKEGAELTGDDGAAYIYVGDGDSWTLQAKLRSSNHQKYDMFGDHVAISGDTAVVTNGLAYEGEPNAGMIYIFQRNGTNWSEQAHFNAIYEGDVVYEIHSVDIDGDTVIASSMFLDGNGAAFIFKRSGTTWTQVATVRPSVTDPIDVFGSSVAISGNRAVVGAIGITEDGDLWWDDGSAYVFVDNDNTWTQEEILKPPNPTKRSDFGTSVDISGETVIVGAPVDGIDWSSPGAYIFSREDSTWSLQAILDSPSGQDDDVFGGNVAIDGDKALVGAIWENGNGTAEEFTSGAAYVFSRVDGHWNEQAYLKASNPGQADYFGYSVGISGDTVIAGAPYKKGDSTGYENAGAAYVFTLTKESATLNPIADSFVSSANPSVNYGTANVIGIKKSSAANLNGYLQFDTSSITCGQLESATLNLYNTDAGTNAGSIYPTANNWTETGIAWNNAPAIGGSPLDTPGAAVLNSWVAFDVTDGVTLGDTFSFGLKGNIADPVSYFSREGSNPPQLVLIYTLPPDGPPVANFSAVPESGIAPLAVNFSSDATGCIESYAWDFGDGGVSTEPNPTHTYDEPGSYTVSLTVTNSEGTDEEIKAAFVTVQPAPPEISTFLISPSSNATIGGIPTTSADILSYNKTANTWTMVYDGSVRGTPKNIAAFHLMDDGSLLLVFSVNQTIAGLGKATPFDVVKFTPNTPGVFPLGPGTYSWFFQGKARGLTTAGEKIDALDLAGNRLLISVAGAANVPLMPSGTLKPADEDVFAFNLGTNQWEDALLIDGSKIPGMAAEDIVGLWDDPHSDDYYVLIAGTFNLSGVTGNSKSIVKLTPNGGATVYTPSLVQWLAPGVTFPSNLDGLDIPG